MELMFLRPPRGFWQRAGRLCLRLLESRAARYAILADPAGHLSAPRRSPRRG